MTSSINTTKRAPRAFQPTERDSAVVRAVYDCRALTTSQIAELVFSSLSKRSRQVKASERLKLLYENGYLWRGEQYSLPSEGKKPFLYRIAKKGVQLVAQLQGVDPSQLEYSTKERSVSAIGLNHLLKSNDVRVAFTLAAVAADHRIKWVDEKTLRRDHANEKVKITIVRGEQKTEKTAAIIPDAYFILGKKTNGYHGLHFFLEVDLATETVQATDPDAKDWSRKINTYMAFYNTGRYKFRYKTNHMTVLTVTTSPERLANLKRATEGFKGRPNFYFTTFEQLTADTALIAPIWQVAGKDQIVAIADVTKMSG